MIGLQGASFVKQLKGHDGLVLVKISMFVKLVDGKTQQVDDSTKSSLKYRNEF